MGVWLGKTYSLCLCCWSLGREWSDRVLCNSGERSPAGRLLTGQNARKSLQQQWAWHWATHEGHKEQNLSGLWPGSSAGGRQWNGGENAQVWISCMDACDAISRQLMIARMVMQCELLLDFLFSPFQLLVNNKIISLDLPVAEVYKKVWCPTNEVCVIFIYINSTKHLSSILTKKWGEKIKITHIRIYFLAYNFLGIIGQHFFVFP